LPFALTSVNRTLYFLADSGLWKSDGTVAGTVPLRGFAPVPSGLTNIDGTLFFFAADPPSADQLWKSNGTPSGTVPVTDIDGFALPYSYSYPNPGNVTNLNGTLLFFAQATDSAPALWKSNGTARTTLRIQDLAPSVYDAPTSPFTISGSNVYFAATDRQHGTELWALPLSALLPPCLGDCDGDGTVTVDELLRGVNLALGSSPLSACPAFDLDGGGTVTIDELTAGVGSALNGCVTITSVM
jgi:ELWxxDGT repeat protein